jgi:lipoate-protein ligase A
MHGLDVIVQPRIAPLASLAADHHFAHAVQRPSRHRLGVLRVYDAPGDVLSLGRYHLLPACDTNTGISCHRRASGGRALPFGDGFVGVSLILPHRSALFGEDPLLLAPYQVMNRYVRGILEACRLANVSAFYPGRDFVTVNRRVLALVSFEVDASGALLFEAIIANQRDFSLLPHWLDAVDPEGVVKAEMLGADGVTCLARELDTTLGTEDVAELLRRGYEQQFGIVCEVRALSSLEMQAIEATAARDLHDGHWLEQRRLRPELNCHASVAIQLGTFEAHFALEQGRFIKEIVFAGDVIANSPGIERLERDLRLCPVEWHAIDAVASEVYAQPENFILGVGRVHTIADVVRQGVPA